MRKDMLHHLASASDTQLDSSMSARLKELIGKRPRDVVEGLVDVLNLSAYGSLASDFVMVAIDTFARSICKDHGFDFDTMLKESAARLEGSR